MKLAIMQPYFLPYIGYFQLMAAVDKFVVYDDVNFIKGGWINRNRIQTFGSIQWLTIPLAGASPNKKIFEIDHQLSEQSKRKIKKTIEGAYQKAPNYSVGKILFDKILDSQKKNLADFLLDSLLIISDYLQLPCRIEPTSRVYQNEELSGQTRILDICMRKAASTYVNLPGGKTLYDPEDFASSGVGLSFIKPQVNKYGEDFQSGLSIIDLIMNTTQETAIEHALDVVH